MAVPKNERGVAVAAGGGGVRRDRQGEGRRRGINEVVRRGRCLSVGAGVRDVGR